jgi:hypothetical protein
MYVHATIMLDGDCKACHGTHPNPKFPVYLKISSDGIGFDPISCVGCHGRDEGGGVVTGKGLRQHHFNNGVIDCLTCHLDSDPLGAFGPAVGEDVMPPYYFTPDAAHPDKPTNPCNPNGEENIVGSSLGLDNDGDNLYDTADPDCGNIEICNDAIDNDGDSLADCLDPDCDGQLGCEFGTELTCNDGIDNDGDSFTDCLDLDCSGQVGCEYGTELTCNDGIDNDGDSFTDCLDLDCDGQLGCEFGTELTCNDGIDNDGDSLADCLDLDCDGQLGCEFGTELTCNDGIDNDADGFSDCLDPDCDGQVGCEFGTELTCNDGIDNDADGFADCLDPDCNGQLGCEFGTELSCFDGVDNDADGLTDCADPDCDGAIGTQTTCGVGECAGNTGNLVCQSGSQVDTCDPLAGALSDDSICDGLDNDCDGPIDEDFVTETTNCGFGVCASTGVTTCVGGVPDDTCTEGSPTEDPEATCNDNLDNDCDGLTDTAEDPDCGADVIPPPVMQNLGFPDSSIADLTEAECRFCHEDPNIVDDANIPNRHHLRVGTPVEDPTVRPFPDGDTNGNYDCFSCHQLVWDGSAFVLETFRDCLFCHNTFSPHHATAQAQAQLCDACHGPVNNPFDGHIIPTYQPSLVTPTRSQGDGLPVHTKDNGSPVFAGGCDYCHDEGLTSGTAVAGEIFARTNQQTHHDTGLFAQSPPVCDWCHDFALPFEEQIRVCERCHGFELLHNIQVDSDATGLVDTDGDGIGDTENLGNIIPNLENPYWGHIGSNDDCWGCHGFALASAPGSGPIVPNIVRLSAYSIAEGTETTLTLSGSAFTNTVQTPDGPFALDSQVVLTAEDGTSTTLTTNTISDSSMDVTIPGTLATGNYIVRAVKGSNDSNAVNIAVIPVVTITDDTCSKKKGVLTINGLGFGTKPEGTDADINVEVNGQTVDLISWSETQIKASVSRCSKNATITVNALYGSAFNSDSGGGKPPKPCKGKGCSK